MNTQPILFTGSSHLKLGQDICRELNINPGKMHLSQFPDGETQVQILEDVQGRDVFVLQSIAIQPNHYLVELLIIIDALKRSSAKTITAIIPYLGYCRQDRKNNPGVPITAKLVANILATAGIANLITCDLHADQVEGFFEINVNHLHCQQLLYEACIHRGEKNYVVVAPDIGGVKRAERMAELLNTELVVIKKERLNAFEVNMTLIGRVSNKNVLIIDDQCSTAGTLVAAANLCKQEGANDIIGALPHALFVNGAINKIESSALNTLFITDTIESRHPLPTFIKSVSVASLLAEAIKNMSR